MKKPDVTKGLRAELDPILGGLGFRWKRMVGVSDGWYVRAWEGGKDTFGFAVASYSPRYSVSAFATVRVDAVEELVTAHVPFSPPEAARQAPSCVVNDLLAFVDGAELRPGETMARAARMVESEEEVRSFAAWCSELVRDRIDPWWRAMRTPGDLWRLDPSWRRFFGHSPPPQLRETALAHLCASPDEQERLEARYLAEARDWPEQPRRWLASLIADLRARRSVG